MFDGLYAVVMSGSLIGIFLQVVPITFLVGLVYAIYRLVKIRKARTVCFVGSRDYALAFCLLLNRTDQSCSCSEKFLDVYLVLSV